MTIEQATTAAPSRIAKEFIVRPPNNFISSYQHTHTLIRLIAERKEIPKELSDTRAAMVFASRVRLCRLGAYCGSAVWASGRSDAFLMGGRRRTVEG